MYCEVFQKPKLADRGDFQFSAPKYWALNLATALAGFVVVFGLASAAIGGGSIRDAVTATGASPLGLWPWHSLE